MAHTDYGTDTGIWKGAIAPDKQTGTNYQFKIKNLFITIFSYAIVKSQKSRKTQLRPTDFSFSRC
ncbi:MAG: hypothetical protein F6K24_55905 [Okeania sp. SIO2D1]|nr:hypothetical protein [Okeania sp. SIO2D1]